MMPRPASSAGSLAQRVYDELLHAINDGRFRPGMRVLEDDVAEWLQVSRTPVREALRRLQSEDVLARSTQGLVVLEIGEDELFELYDLRETLEATAAQWAARNANTDDRRLLARVLKQESNCRDDAPADLAAINRDFHRAVARAAHNRFLYKTLNSLQDAFLRLRSSTLSLPGRAKQALDEHRDIVSAIERGDPVAAAKAARRHIRRARRDRLQLNGTVRAAAGRPKAAIVAPRASPASRTPAGRDRP